MTPMAIDLVSVTDLRARITDVMEELQRARRPLYVTQRGQARAVLLSVAEYNALIEQLDYAGDSLEAALARERLAAGEKARPFEDDERDREKRGVAPRRNPPKMRHPREVYRKIR